jgi:hypothetical protein
LCDLHRRTTRPYSVPGLEASHRTSAEGNYYYFCYNGKSALDAAVSLAGKGTPYQLDAWTGGIVPLALFSKTDGRINVNLKLEPGEATIIAVAEDATQFPKSNGIWATATSGGEVRGSLYKF